jgi:hypothetical protein
LAFLSVGISLSTIPQLAFALVAVFPSRYFSQS